MKVARLHAAGDLRLAEEAVPRPEPGMSLVRVSAVGICGSDLHWGGGGGVRGAHVRPLPVRGAWGAGGGEGGPRRGGAGGGGQWERCGPPRAVRGGVRDPGTPRRCARDA